jgi:hypothetical protein
MSSVFMMRRAAAEESTIPAIGDSLRRSSRTTNFARLNPDDVECGTVVAMR